MNSTSKKYTLSLPTEIYDELFKESEKHDRSVKDVLRQCLKFGLIAMKVAEDQNQEIIFRERTKVGERDGQPVFENKDTIVRFVL